MLRGGPLAEKRVIDLLNKRFVAFYYNVGKRGPGHDAKAAKFIARVDKRFGGNMVPTPPVWVFAPDGKLLKTINNYITKERFHRALVRVLNKHPEFNAMTEDEKTILATARKDAQNSKARLAAGRLTEALARYQDAKEHYEAVSSAKDGHRPQALLGLLRLSRFAKDWSAMDKLLTDCAELDEEGRTAIAPAIAVERGYRLMSDKDWKASYEVLAPAAKKYDKSLELGELHFYAGVSAYRLGKKRWANFHFSWVMQNIPDDHLYMRCYLAATAEAMPYRNFELGTSMRGGRITHNSADKARKKALRDYKRLLPQWQKAQKAVVRRRKGL